MSIIITQLYQSLSKKLGNDTAEELTSFITQDISDKIEQRSSSLATKEDVANAKVDMIKWLVGLFITLALMIVGLYLKK